MKVATYTSKQLANFVRFNLTIAQCFNAILSFMALGAMYLSTTPIAKNCALLTIVIVVATQILIHIGNAIVHTINHGFQSLLEQAKAESGNTEEETEKIEE